MTRGGRARASPSEQRVHPTTESGLTVWIGVGGSPESVVRAVHSPGHVADTDEEGRERAGAEGAVQVGEPETVARKIASTARLLGLSRFDLKHRMGALPHDQLMPRIELDGMKAIPLVGDVLA